MSEPNYICKEGNIVFADDNWIAEHCCAGFSVPSSLAARMHQAQKEQPPEPDPAEPSSEQAQDHPSPKP